MADEVVKEEEQQEIDLTGKTLIDFSLDNDQNIPVTQLILNVYKDDNPDKGNELTMLPAIWGRQVWDCKGNTPLQFGWVTKYMGSGIVYTDEYAYDKSTPHSQKDLIDVSKITGKRSLKINDQVSIYVKAIVAEDVWYDGDKEGTLERYFCIPFYIESPNLDIEEAEKVIPNTRIKIENSGSIDFDFNTFYVVPDMSDNSYKLKVDESNGFYAYLQEHSNSELENPIIMKLTMETL